MVNSYFLKGFGSIEAEEAAGRLVALARQAERISFREVIDQMKGDLAAMQRARSRLGRLRGAQEPPQSLLHTWGPDKIIRGFHRLRDAGYVRIEEGEGAYQVIVLLPLFLNKVSTVS